MKYRLTGEIGWSVGSCHDDRSQAIEEEFSAQTLEKAVARAKKMVEKLHKKWSNSTDYTLVAELQEIKTVWGVHFDPGQKAVPATPAEPSRPAGLKERRHR